MREIALFVEDFAHQAFLDALLHRFATAHGIAVHLDWRNARRGHGAVLRELKQFLRDLQQQREFLPDLVIVATDANCKGQAARVAELTAVTKKTACRTLCAVPQPHIERWLLVDSAAFKHVFGRGCDAPDLKCDRGRYKQMLADSIHAAGIVPSFGGIEFTADIVKAMDLDRARAADTSLARLLGELGAIFRDWQRHA